MGESALSQHSGGAREPQAFWAELQQSGAFLRAEMAALAASPRDPDPRQGLLARLRLLAVEAASRGESLVVEELGACRAIAKGVALLGRLSEEDARRFASALQRLGEQAHAALEALDQDETSGPVPAVTVDGVANRVVSVAVVGGANLASSLAAEDRAHQGDGSALTVRSIASLAAARRRLPELLPQVVVVDADQPASQRLVERLVSDPATETIPVLVVGAFTRTADAAPFIALGAARTLVKPVSPSELRSACIEVVPSVKRGLDPLGALTLDGLAMRLTTELHRGLCDAADDDVRQQVVDFGDGSELLTAMWRTIEQMRNVVTARSNGAIRFRQSEPIEALPRPVWLNETAPDGLQQRSQGSARRRGDRSLEGCTVVVAEDDPSMNWFICGVLREAGATVHGCYDGMQALDLVYQQLPDLLISDVVMPELDGYTLCRALKRDVMLGSLPVMLLSWKQDLLQRMRELGAGADGYLRKEASSQDILERVSEVLSPRRAVAKRIIEQPDAQGRIDGLTTLALLRLVCSHRSECRLSVRDASFRYEIEIREGRPVRALRSSEDGVVERGEKVMLALLALTGGRFSIELRAEDGLKSEFEGSLASQLVVPLARARAAQMLLRGPQLLEVEQVDLDEPQLQLAATPEPTRGLLVALLAGRSPADLLSSGHASSELLERVLSDTVRQGAVTAVRNIDGEDLLVLQVERELAVLRGDADRSQFAASHHDFVRATIGALPAAPPQDQPSDEPSSYPRMDSGIAELVADDDLLEPPLESPGGGSAEPMALASDAPELDPLALAALAFNTSPGPASDLDDTVDIAPDVAVGFAEFAWHDDASQPEARPAELAHAAADAVAPEDEGRTTLAKPSDILAAAHALLSGQAHDDNTVELDAPHAAGPVSSAPLPLSKPVDPLSRPERPNRGDHTPVLASGFEVALEPIHHTPVLSRVGAIPPRFAELDGVRADDDASQLATAATSQPASKETVLASPSDAAPSTEAQPPAAIAATPAAVAFVGHVLPPPEQVEPTLPRLPLPSRWATRPSSPRPESSASRYLWPVFFGVVGISLAVGARWVREREVVVPPPLPPIPAVAVDPAAAAPPAKSPATAKDMAASANEAAVELPLSAKDLSKLAPGQGLLEVVAGRKDKVFVAGELKGRGPVVKVALAAREEPYEIRVKLRGEERVRYVVVREKKRMRLRVAPPWSQ